MNMHKRDFIIGMSLPDVTFIEAQKIEKADDVKLVSLYYKDIDKKIKLAGDGIKKDFIINLKKKLIEKYGEIYNSNHDIKIYIKKDVLADKPFFIHFLIDTEANEEYFEVFVAKTDTETKEKDFINVLNIGLFTMAHLADEIQNINLQTLKKQKS